MTGLQTLWLVSDAYGVDRTDASRRYHGVLERLSSCLPDDLLVEQYSLGMKRKLGLALSLIANPPVVIWDEPEIGLDAVSRVGFRDLVAHLRQQGVLVVPTTHAIDLAESLADRIAVLTMLGAELRLPEFGRLSIMQRLVAGDPGAVAPEDVAARVAFLAALLPPLAVASRRREEPCDVVSASLRLSDRLVNLGIDLFPRSWRVAGRLTSPSLGGAFVFRFSNSAITGTTAAALVLAGPELAEISKTQLRLSFFGNVLTALSAVGVLPLLKRLGVIGESYAHLRTLPLPLSSLVPRMVFLGLLTYAVIQVVIIGSWGQFMHPIDEFSCVVRLGLVVSSGGGVVRCGPAACSLVEADKWCSSKRHSRLAWASRFA